MSNDVVVKPARARNADFSKSAASIGKVTLYVQGTLLGFVSTRLRAHSEASLDAIYRVIETSALGTLSRKHFYFVRETPSGMVSACAAYLTHYKDPSDALGKRYGVPKLVKRRSFTRLVQCLRTSGSIETLTGLQANQSLIDHIYVAAHKVMTDNVEAPPVWEESVKNLGA
jgi:hypothetical protein